MDFNGIFFKGKFREYQQRVLDNSSKYLIDNKINIVAAPGSGKTILGLELIRRLNKPCIILSPTTIIRQQWGARFCDSFLDDKSKINDYVSYDLNNIKLINSITYQALYSSINKIATISEDEEIDYSNIELFQLIKENNILTICLDEAHHLQNEWQKALEKFIKGLDKNITVISLTATPPYDASGVEWARYVGVCGDIDDEIFVPELVKEKTLCPHQDYIIFNYPSDLETASFKQQYSNSFNAINEITHLQFMNSLNLKIEELYKNNNEYIYSNFAEIVALYILLNYGNYKVNKKYFYKLTNSNVIPSLNKKYAETAVNFLLSSDILTTEDKENVVSILKKWMLFERKKAIFDLSDKQKRSLISSVGKLISISKIVGEEMNNLGDNLIMLILTDYIKKEGLYNIGKDIQFDNISVVSIFETIRREYPISKLACLSGTLVIVSKEIVDELRNNQNITNKISYTKFENTDFFNVSFKGHNREKVEIISRLFEEGKINILIGTQALLGEGWDSPCINSLILASYVGSFMLSNQMRGRAIRSYKNDPNKTSNIWHLVTIEPEYIFESNVFKKLILELNNDKKHINSCDYETITRRFDCFIGPNYDTGEIESGIERITIIKPPFTKDNIDKINELMFQRSKKRDNLRIEWNKAVNLSTKTNVVVEVPRECSVPVFTYTNILGLLVGSAVIAGVCAGINPLIRIIANRDTNITIIFIAAIILILAFLYMGKLMNFIIRNISPRKSIESMSKTILKTMKELELINKDSTLIINADDLNTRISVALKNATIHEQNIFNEAIKELLSPIENPRYLIIKKNLFNGYDYRNSFACPSILSDNDLRVQTLRKYFKAMGKIDVIYAHYDLGKEISFKCRKYSFISRNYREISKKYKVTKFE
jgi:superfamily II DNA or RNA helicase